MAQAPQTGMEKQEMKALLAKSKQEPVNCAVGIGADAAVALLMMHKTKASKALEADVKKMPGAKNVRFGTVFVDLDADPKLVKFNLNSPASGLARRLSKTLKGTGLSKVEILVDGAAVESAAGEEEDAGGGATAATPAAAPAPEPGAIAALTKEFAALALGIKAVADPARKAQLVKLAGVANQGIKGGNAAAAATAIAQLRTALGGGSGAATPPGQWAAAKPEGAAPGAPVDLARLNQAWLAARKRVESGLRLLVGEAKKAYEGEGLGNQVERRLQARAKRMMAGLDGTLTADLAEAAQRPEAERTADLAKTLKAAIDKHAGALSSDTDIDDLDSNPFGVPLAIRKTVGDTLKGLSAAIR